MQGSQAANHTHDLLTQRIHLCCAIFKPINWKWERTLFLDITMKFTMWVVYILCAITYYMVENLNVQD